MSRLQIILQNKYASIVIFPGKCTKDILVIIDMSYSITYPMFQRKIKPFLYHLFADNTLDVSPIGSNFAIMVFSTEEKTKLLVSFDEGVYQKSLQQRLKGLHYRVLSGGFTQTNVALQLANQVCTIFMNHLILIDQKVVTHHY